MNWNWDASSWRKSLKVLLGAATIWPIIYMIAFLALVISLIVVTERNRNPCGEIDILQLDRKIRDGEIRKLSIKSRQIVATDRNDGCTYELFVPTSSSREDILRDAKEVINGKPRVEEIDENGSEAAEIPNPFSAILPVGFLVLMIFHLATVVLMTAQMPFYIILAVKNKRLQQTPMIVWIVLIALFSIFVTPVYWYLYIWRKPKTPLPTDDRSDGLGMPVTT